jgi:hypothetical protein
MSFGNNYNNYNNHWIFVNDRYFGRNDIQRYYSYNNDYNRILRNSNVINNTYVDNRYHSTYISGPDRGEVQRVTGRRVNSYSFQENNTPGQDLRNGQFRTYRPQITKTSDNKQQPSPSCVTNLQDVRRPSERNSYNLKNSNTERIQQQNTDNQQNAGSQQNGRSRRNTINQRNAINQQNTIDRQNEINRQNTINQRNAVDQKNTVDRQNEINRQNNTERQNAVDQQNTRKDEREIKQRNAKRIRKSEDPWASKSEADIRNRF